MNDFSVNAVALNVAVWLACGVSIGWWYASRDWRRLRAPGLITRLRNLDQRSLYERVLHVHYWKDLLPEAGTWFGGMSKRRLPRRSAGGLERFAAESLRAERVHWALLLVVPLVMTWSRGWWIPIHVSFGIAVNAPCIVVARYNRLRIALLS